MSLPAHLQHDARTFVEWRDQTADAWEQLATYVEERVPLSDHPADHRRRARTLRKFARQLRAEVE